MGFVVLGILGLIGAAIFGAGMVMGLGLAAAAVGGAVLGAIALAAFIIGLTTLVLVYRRMGKGVTPTSVTDPFI